MPSAPLLDTVFFVNELVRKSSLTRSLRIPLTNIYAKGGYCAHVKLGKQNEKMWCFMVPAEEDDEDNNEEDKTEGEDKITFQ